MGRVNVGELAFVNVHTCSMSEVGVAIRLVADGCVVHVLHLQHMINITSSTSSPTSKYKCSRHYWLNVSKAMFV